MISSPARRTLPVPSKTSGPLLTLLPHWPIVLAHVLVDGLKYWAA